MFRPSSTRPSATATPAPSSPPPPSESFLSELDGTPPSALGTGSLRDFAPAAPKVDPTSLNLVSWKLDVNARAEIGVEKRGFNGA
jgi:vacuolar protein sorting-associated protein 54